MQTKKGVSAYISLETRLAEWGVASNLHVVSHSQSLARRESLVNEALLTLDNLQLSPKQCKLCVAQLLIAYPSWGGCWNKTYMGS